MAPIAYVDWMVIFHNEREVSHRALNRGVSLPRQSLGGDALNLASIERLSAWVEADFPCSRPDLELLGQHLYRCMFGPADAPANASFQAALVELKGQRDLRLRLTVAFEPEANRLASYPWEFLHAPFGESGLFIAAPDTSQLILTRFVPPPLAIIETLEPDERPLKILVVVSSPEGVAPIQPNALIAQLENMSRERSDEVNVVVMQTPSLTDIETKLYPVGEKPWSPDIVHFIGHGDIIAGESSLAIRMGKDDEDELFMKTGARTPNATWIPTSSLLDIFDGDHLPRLVFLHACRGGAERRSYRGFVSGAEKFVRAGVPAAIAMQYDIASDEAEIFAQRFYTQLDLGMPVDDAVTTARRELAKRTRPKTWSDRTFGTPLLYLQSTGAILLSAPPVAPAPQVGTPEPVEFPCPYRKDAVETL